MSRFKAKKEITPGNLRAIERAFEVTDALDVTHQVAIEADPFRESDHEVSFKLRGRKINPDGTTLESDGTAVRTFIREICINKSGLVGTQVTIESILEENIERMIEHTLAHACAMLAWQRGEPLGGDA